MDEIHRRLLQGMPIFGGVSDEVLELLVERAGKVSVPAGAFLCREGQREDAAYVLERGSVSVLKNWRGRDYLLRRLGEGDCFGEMTLIDFAPRSASVRADEPCMAMRITAADLRAVHALDIEQYALVYLNMAREVSRRLRSADLRLFETQAQAGLFEEGYGYRGL